MKSRVAFNDQTANRWARLAGVYSAATAIMVLAMAIWLSRDPDFASSPAGNPLTEAIPDILLAFSFAIVGSFVSIKRPDNLVGWAMVLSGTGLLTGGLFSGYAGLALFAKPEWELPGGTAAASIDVASWVPLMAGVFLLLVYFPSGHAQSSRWRTLARFVSGSFLLIFLGIAAGPGHLDPPYDAFENPLALPFSKALPFVVFPLIGVCLFSVIAAVSALVIRFRRSHGDEREQYKWLVFSGGMLALTMPFAALVNWNGIPGAIFTLALIGLPVSVGIAVLRYHLYEIDRILNRTLSYGLLTALLGGLYVALVIGLQEVLRPVSGGSDAAIVITTLVIAALFLPARQRVQHVVDRRFNRHHYDAERTIEAFAARLREQIDLDTLRYEVLSVIDETMQPEAVSLWLRERS